MGAIGTCHYLAHVDKQARVCWMCLSRFDSGHIFGGLLEWLMNAVTKLASSQGLPAFF